MHLDLHQQPELHATDNSYRRQHIDWPAASPIQVTCGVHSGLRRRRPTGGLDTDNVECAHECHCQSRCQWRPNRSTEEHALEPRATPWQQSCPPQGNSKDNRPHRIYTILRALLFFNLSLKDLLTRRLRLHDASATLLKLKLISSARQLTKRLLSTFRKSAAREGCRPTLDNHNS
jgi:hypothetical protein